MARGVPHVPTSTFVRLEDAYAFFDTATYPLVVKTRHDSGGHGVERIANRREGRAIARVFLQGRFHRRGLRDWRDAEHGALIAQPFLPVAERSGLHCGAIDLLTLEDGSWVVGEVQTWYGGVRVMNHHGVPHVAWREAHGWRLEEGMPHVHRGQSLRLKAFDDWLGRGAPAADLLDSPLVPSS